MTYNFIYSSKSFSSYINEWMSSAKIRGFFMRELPKLMSKIKDAEDVPRKAFYFSQHQQYARVKSKTVWGSQDGALEWAHGRLRARPEDIYRALSQCSTDPS